MSAGRWCSITLVVFSIIFIFGCGREKPKSDFELGKENFLASNYSKAMVNLQEWVMDKDNPNLVEAHAMLAVIYHDYENREAEYALEMKKLQEIGEPAMTAVLKLLERPQTASRLGNTINDILVQGGKLSVNPLMKNLRSANWRLKINAQSVLIKIGEPAVEPLIAALDDQDPYTKSMVIEALNRIGNKSAVGPIEEQMKLSNNKIVQIAAAAALHSMGRVNPTNIIVSGLEDADVEVRRMAAKAAWEVMEKPPVSTMMKLINDTDPGVRNYAALVLGKYGGAEAVPLLVKALVNDTDENVVNSATAGLENIGAPAVEPLIGVLEKSNDMETIIRVAHILGNIGDKRAIEPMDKVYKKDTRSLVRNEVAKALNKID